MPGGRPTSYKPEYAEKAYTLCKRFGAIDEQLAVVFDTSVVTLNSWKKKFPKFLKALKEGKAYRDEHVVRSLYERAMGYEHPETKVFNDHGEIITHEIIKHYPPDPTAMIFWLKNRQPEKWRDKKDVEVDANVTIKLVDSFAGDNNTV